MSDEKFTLARGVSPLQKCKACPTKIVFAYTAGGNKAPYHRDDKGLFVLENGCALPYHEPRQLELGAPPPAMPERWTSHFATCPAAREFRKRDRGAS